MGIRQVFEVALLNSQRAEGKLISLKTDCTSRCTGRIESFRAVSLCLLIIKLQEGMRLITMGSGEGGGGRGEGINSGRTNFKSRVLNNT